MDPTKIPRTVNAAATWRESLKAANAAAKAKKEAERAARLLEEKSLAAGKSTPPPSEVSREDFKGEGYHYTVAEEPFDFFDYSKAYDSAWDKIGVHVGSKKSSKDRFEHSMEVRNVTNTDNSPSVGHTLQLVHRTDKPLLNPEGKPWSETEFKNYLREFVSEYPKEFQYALNSKKEWRLVLKEEQTLSSQLAKLRERQYERELAFKQSTYLPTEKEQTELKMGRLKIDKLWRQLVDVRDFKKQVHSDLRIQIIREKLIAEGYTHVPYRNDAEDSGSISAIILNPARNLRHKNAAFKKEYGGIMSGAASAAVVSGEAKDDAK